MFGFRRNKDASFPGQEQPTRPDTPSLRVAATAEEVRTRTWEAMVPVERERDVINRICSADGIDRDSFQNARKVVNAGRLVFAEYASYQEDESIDTSYVYITPGYKVPGWILSCQLLEPEMLNPTTPILVKINHRCEVKVLHRWED